MTTSHGITRVLSVAGSDSGGGAGIQADLKAFARCGVHGTVAVTVVTAQNTRGVAFAHAVPPEVIVAQIEAVAGDIGVDAVKVGMLGSREAVVAVAAALSELKDVPIVVDPVLVASTGARLLAVDALDAFGELLLPLATVVTPNLPEARTLVGHLGPRPDPAPRERRPAAGSRPDDHDGDHLADDAADDRRTDAGLARALRRLGPRHVVLTGGHRDITSDLYRDGETLVGPHWDGETLVGPHWDGETLVDLYWDGETLVEIPGKRHPDAATHGSGCTHSAVLAAQLGLGRSVLEAARLARSITGQAVASGLAGLGAGEGPVDVLGRTGRTDPSRLERLP